MNPSIPSILQVGQTIVGKYRIERVLGEGGMGQVLLATHLDLNEHCAVKVLHRGALNHPDAYERFVREARVARQLKSQHAVKVYDFGRLETGEPYIVMEFLDGVDLRELVLQRGPLPFQEAVLYVTQACEAIGEAHAAGIIHRDLKPANLFLTPGVHGRACIKVLDFGIAKMATRAGGKAEREMTGNAMMGTLAYMSPEQMLSSRTVDHRADIWSMGVVLFRLLTDVLPFEDTGEGLGIVDSVINGSPTPLATIDPSLPPGLCAVVACCLQKDREQRYPTAMDLADALSPFFVPEPRPSSGRASRWDHTLEAATRKIPQPAASSPSSSSSSRSAPSLHSWPSSSPSFHPSPAPSAPSFGPSSSPSFQSSPSVRAADSEKTALLPPPPRSTAPLPRADGRTGPTEASWVKPDRRPPDSRSRIWILAVCAVVAVGGAVAAWRLVQGADPQTAFASDPSSPAPAASTSEAAPSAPLAPGSAAVSSATPGANAAPATPTPLPDPAERPPAAPPQGGSLSPVASKPAQPVPDANAGKTPTPAPSPPATAATPPAATATTAPPPASDPFKNDRK